MDRLMRVKHQQHTVFLAVFLTHSLNCLPACLCALRSTLDGDVQETIRRMFHTTEASVSSPEPSHAAARSARTSLGDSASLLHHSRMGPGHPLSGGGAKPPPMGTPGTGGSRRLGVPDRPGFSSFSAWVVDGRPDPTEPLYPPVMPAVGSSTPPAAHRSSYQYQHFGGMPAPMLASYPGPLSQAGGSPYGVTTSDVFTCVPNSAGGAAVARSTTTWATNPLGAALPAATSPSPVPSWRNAADNTVFVMNLNPVFLDGEPGAANGVASVAAEAHRPASVAGEAVAPHARMRPGRSTAGASTPGMGRMSRYGPGAWITVCCAFVVILRLCIRYTAWCRSVMHFMLFEAVSFVGAGCLGGCVVLQLLPLARSHRAWTITLISGMHTA